MTPAETRILLYSDSVYLHTGFARVTRTFGNYLVDRGYQVKQVGITAVGQGDDPVKFEVITNDPNQDYWNHGGLRQTLRDWRPHILFTLLDDWMLAELPLMVERQGTVWIKYAPYDGEPMPRAWVPINYDADILVAMADYGVRQLKKECPDRPVHLLYHGADPAVFKPLGAEVKTRVRAELGIPRDAWVVGFVSRFQPRKNAPSAFKAFQLFHKNHKKDTHLLIRASRSDVGGDFMELLDRLDLADCTTIVDSHPAVGVPEARLVEIYNAMDVTLHPSTGEGFGVTSCESRACGVPAIVTNFSAMPDLVSGPEELARVKHRIVSARFIEQAYVDEQDMAQKIERFYSNKRLYADYSRRGRERVEQIFNWSLILPQMEAIIQEGVSLAERQHGHPVWPHPLPLHLLP